MRSILLVPLFFCLTLPALAQTAPAPSTNHGRTEAASSEASTDEAPPSSPVPSPVNLLNGRSGDVRATAPESATPSTGIPNGNGRTSRSEPASAPVATTAPKAVSDGSKRVSLMGPNGDPAYDAIHPAVAYDGSRDRYLVVWAGTDDASGLAPGESEIYGRLVSGGTGDPLGNTTRFSMQGPDGDAAFAAQHPVVVYNPDQDEFLVAWQGSATAGEEEVYALRVNANDLTTGSPARISRLGADGDAAVDALTPDVAYNPAEGQYLIVYHGTASGESEIYAQRVAGDDLGFRTTPQTLSSAGPDGSDAWYAVHPAIAYAAPTNSYVVAWAGTDDAAGTAEGEVEIYVQRLDATGAEIGTDDQRISQAGSDGDATVDAVRPAVQVDAVQSQAFVTWSSNAADGPTAYELIGQRLDLATGAEVGTDDLRLSTMGPDGTAGFSGFAAAVAGVPGREYYVLWRGDDTTDDAFEIYGQRVFADLNQGDEGGNDDERLSGLSPNSAATGAVAPAVASNGTGTYLLVWSGDTTADVFVEGEHEIFSRLVQPGTPLPVELTSFEAASVREGVALTWATAGETNNAGFAVERRRSGPETAWTTVGEVPGAGTTTAPQRYRFTDTDLPYTGDRFVYRLRQVDTDGAAVLSEERTVTRGAVTALELRGTFPNPARTQATVRFAVPEDLARQADVRLRLYDLLGRAVRTTTVAPGAERREVRLSLSGLSPGTYFLRLTAGGQVQTQKLTVIR